MTPETIANQERLESWKEIAAYLHRDVRTARRWEKERGLPVHRVPGKRPGVHAFAAEIDVWSKGGVDGHSGAPSSDLAPPTPRSGARWPASWIMASCVLLLTIALLSGFLAAKPAAPQIRDPVVLTHDGWSNGSLVGGGASLFYRSTASAGMRDTITRLGEAGGEPSTIRLPGYRLHPLGADRDGSRLLISEDSSQECHWPIWEAMSAGGPPRRFGDLCASAAAWSSDGRKLAFVSGQELYLANADGSGSRRLAVLPFGDGAELRWSPDGKRLRFVLEKRQGDRLIYRLWEVTLDHAEPRPVLPDWSRAASDEEHGGNWTKDGRFFLFTAIHEGTSGIWSIRDHTSAFAWRETSPTLLATVPDEVSSPTPSSDGNKLFAVVKLPLRGELLRLDPGTRQFALYPKMRGLSAGQLAFSPDGRQVVYAAHPATTLWLMNVDGTKRRLLTPGSDGGALPQWSPDGRRIAFMGWKTGENGRSRIRIVSPEGSGPLDAIPAPGGQGAPSWTSDTELVFGDNGPTFPIAASCSLHAFDFKTGKTTGLPGTTGLWTPRACPAGRYIAAQTRDNRKLMLYDRRTARLTELLASPGGPLGDNPVWSKDGESIYMDAPYADEPAIYRIRIADARIERLASLGGIQRAVGNIGLWMGLAPDGCLLILRQLQGSEIYAWDLVEP
jgi:Tol biopolymer transport system component